MKSPAAGSASAPGRSSGGWFAELFGLRNDDTAHENYSEAVRRCGAIDVDEHAERWKAAGYTGYDRNAKPLTRDEIARDRDTLQVVQEDLKVGKRAVQRGVVRVHQRVTEKPVQEQVTLNEERAVVEEVEVRKVAKQRTETVKDKVRRTDVDVERSGGDGQAQPRKRYTGVERRKKFGNYTGMERRAAR